MRNDPVTTIDGQKDLWYISLSRLKKLLNIFVFPQLLLHRVPREEEEYVSRSTRY